MRIDDVITHDHRDIERRFDALAELAHDDRHATEAARLAVELAIAIRTYGRAEEQVVYEVIRTAGARLAACALEGPHELEALDTVLDRLLVLRPGPEFRAALAVARRLFDEHARHEQRELLPALAEALPVDERELLGADLVGAQRRLRPRIARDVAG